ncbi:unnamed protein product, partial [Prorocentrum cordatum]
SIHGVPAAFRNALTVDLTGKVAFIAGIADTTGYGWAIARELANAGATIIIGTWPPVLKIFERGLKAKGIEEAMKLDDGSQMEIAKIYPLDAMYDSPEDVPEDVKTNKRYAGLDFTIQEAVEAIKADYGKVDILVHSLANGPEVKKPLLETSRSGYLAASSASAYSLVSMVSKFGPIMPPGGSVLSLSYIASERVVPGYGGGMSSAKAQLESDTRTLAFEAGRKYRVRVNTISAGLHARDRAVPRHPARADRAPGREVQLRRLPAVVQPGHPHRPPCPSGGPAAAGQHVRAGLHRCRPRRVSAQDLHFGHRLGFRGAAQRPADVLHLRRGGRQDAGGPGPQGPDRLAQAAGRVHRCVARGGQTTEHTVVPSDDGGSSAAGPPAPHLDGPRDRRGPEPRRDPGRPPGGHERAAHERQDPGAARGAHEQYGRHATRGAHARGVEPRAHGPGLTPPAAGARAAPKGLGALREPCDVGSCARVHRKQPRGSRKRIE